MFLSPLRFGTEQVPIRNVFSFWNPLKKGIEIKIKKETARLHLCRPLAVTKLLYLQARHAHLLLPLKCVCRIYLFSPTQCFPMPSHPPKAVVFTMRPICLILQLLASFPCPVDHPDLHVGMERGLQRCLAVFCVTWWEPVSTWKPGSSSTRIPFLSDGMCFGWDIIMWCPSVHPKLSIFGVDGVNTQSHPCNLLLRLLLPLEC